MNIHLNGVNKITLITHGIVTPMETTWLLKKDIGLQMYGTLLSVIVSLNMVLSHQVNDYLKKQTSILQYVIWYKTQKWNLWKPRNCQDIIRLRKTLSLNVSVCNQMIISSEIVRDSKISSYHGTSKVLSKKLTSVQHTN